MSGAFVRKYTDDQREAMISARLDRGMTFRRVVEVARAGELTAPDGTRLEPFDPPISTIASLARDAKKRRMGKQVSQVAQLPARDAIEALRRRLVNAADAMLEHELKRPLEKRDPERLRQIGRCVREFAAIPAQKDPTPTAPGSKQGGERNGGATQGGIGGSIIAAHRQGSTAQEASSTHTHMDGEAPEQNGTGAANAAEERTEDSGPGSLARAVALRAPVPA
jgi:hypothetical protein